MDDKETTGAKLQALLGMHGIDGPRRAAKLGLGSERSLSYWLAGRFAPSGLHRLKLLHAFFGSIEPDYLSWRFSLGDCLRAASRVYEEAPIRSAIASGQPIPTPKLTTRVIFEKFADEAGRHRHLKVVATLQSERNSESTR